MSKPLEGLLSEYKAKTAPSPPCCKNIVIRACIFLSGKKMTFYQGFVILGFAAIAIFRQFGGLLLFQQLLPVTAFVGGMLFTWVRGSSGKVASSILDEVLWVADLVEKNAPRKIERQNRRIARLSRLYFWVSFWGTIATLASMAIPIMEGSTLLPTPLPDSELVGELTATVLRWGMCIWQSAFLTLVGFAYAWVDGLYFGAILVIYALTKSLAQSIRSVDFSKEENIETLIRAHQILLKAAQLCNECMSVTNCILVIVTVYLSVVTGFALIVDNTEIDRILDASLSAMSIIRLGYISGLIAEASIEMSSAVYESPWIDAIFSNKIPLSSVHNLVTMVAMRAQKPMYLRAGFMGALGNEFTLKFLRSLYTYFQALENLV